MTLAQNGSPPDQKKGSDANVSPAPSAQGPIAEPIQDSDRRVRGRGGDSTFVFTIVPPPGKVKPSKLAPEESIEKIVQYLKTTLPPAVKIELQFSDKMLQPGFGPSEGQLVDFYNGYLELMKKAAVPRGGSQSEEQKRNFVNGFISLIDDCLGRRYDPPSQEQLRAFFNGCKGFVDKFHDGPMALEDQERLGEFSKSFIHLMEKVFGKTPSDAKIRAFYDVLVSHIHTGNVHVLGDMKDKQSVKLIIANTSSSTWLITKTTHETLHDLDAGFMDVDLKQKIIAEMGDGTRWYITYLASRQEYNQIASTVENYNRNFAAQIGLPDLAPDESYIAIDLEKFRKSLNSSFLVANTIPDFRLREFSNTLGFAINQTDEKGRIHFFVLAGANDDRYRVYVDVGKDVNPPAECAVLSSKKARCIIFKEGTKGAEDF